MTAGALRCWALIALAGLLSVGFGAYFYQRDRGSDPINYSSDQREIATIVTRVALPNSYPNDISLYRPENAFFYTPSFRWLVQASGTWEDNYVGAFRRLTWAVDAVVLFSLWMVFWKISGRYGVSLVLALLSALPTSGLGDTLRFGPFASTTPRVLAQGLAACWFGAMLLCADRAAGQRPHALPLVAACATAAFMVVIHPPTGVFCAAFTPFWLFVSAPDSKAQWRYGIVSVLVLAVPVVIYQLVWMTYLNQGDVLPDILKEAFGLRYVLFDLRVPVQTWADMEGHFLPVVALLLFPFLWPSGTAVQPRCRLAQKVAWAVLLIPAFVAGPFLRGDFWTEAPARWAALAKDIGASSEFWHRKTGVPSALAIMGMVGCLVLGAVAWFRAVQREKQDLKSDLKPVTRMAVGTIAAALALNGILLFVSRITGGVPIAELLRSTRYWFLIALFAVAVAARRLRTVETLAVALALATLITWNRGEQTFNFVRTLNLGTATAAPSTAENMRLATWARENTSPADTFLFLDQDPNASGPVETFRLVSQRGVAYSFKSGGTLLSNDLPRLPLWLERNKALSTGTPTAWNRLLDSIQHPLIVVIGTEAGETFCKSRSDALELLHREGKLSAWRWLRPSLPRKES